MILKHGTIAAAAFLMLGACEQSEITQIASETTAPAEAASAQQETGAIESSAASGVYAPDPKHRYITFSYLLTH